MDRPRLEDAFGLAARGDDARAADVLAALAAETPAHATVHVLLARACERLHRWPGALAAWQSARLLLPEAAFAEQGALRAARVLAALSTMAGPEAYAPRPAAPPPPAAPTEPATVEDEPVPPAEAPAFEADPEGFRAPSPEVAAPEPAAPEIFVPEPAAFEAAESAPFDPFGAARPALVWAPILARAAEEPAHSPGPAADEPPPPVAAFEPAAPNEAPPAPTSADPLAPPAPEPFPWAEPEPGPSGLDAPAEAPASRFEGAADPFDLDSLIDSLNAAGRIRPRDDLDSIPPPEGLDDDDGADNLVSETLARIYAGQGQHAEAARVYEQLARQLPEQRERLLAEADALRARKKG